MFIPTWLIFLGTGTIMAVVVLIWSIKNHQFDDQERARYLPLAGLSPQELRTVPEPKKGITYYTLIALMACGPLSMAYVLYIIIKLG